MIACVPRDMHSALWSDVWSTLTQELPTQRAMCGWSQFVMPEHTTVGPRDAARAEYLCNSSFCLTQVKERIINVGSISAGSRMDWRNLEGEQSYDADTQYATSKASLTAPVHIAKGFAAYFSMHCSALTLHPNDRNGARMPAAGGDDGDGGAGAPTGAAAAGGALPGPGHRQQQAAGEGLGHDRHGGPGTIFVLARCAGTQPGT